MFIRDLEIGQDFVLTGQTTVYRVTGKTYGPEYGPGCSITYVIPASAEPNYRFTFTKPALSTCSLIGN